MAPVYVARMSRYVIPRVFSKELVKFGQNRSEGTLVLDDLVVRTAAFWVSRYFGRLGAVLADDLVRILLCPRDKRTCALD